MSALELQRQISETVEKNVELLESILEHKFYVSERIKITAVIQAVNTTCYKPQTFRNMNRVIEGQSYFKALKLERYIEDYTHFDKCPEVLKLHVQTIFLSPLNYNSYLAKLLRVALRPFNKIYFEFPLKEFYCLVLRYFFRDDCDKKLANHLNFHTLKQVKARYEMVYNAMMADFISKDMAAIFKIMNKTCPIEIMPTSQDYPETSAESCFSLRTLSSQLCLQDLDLFLFLRPDFDE